MRMMTIIIMPVLYKKSLGITWSVTKSLRVTCKQEAQRP